MSEGSERAMAEVPAPAETTGPFSQVTLRPRPESRLFPYVQDGAIGVEQFRLLNARLAFLRSRRTLRSLMVTSAVASEGKTSSAANLALVMAREGGRKVLLVDADLRKPQVHNVLGIPNTYGLSDVLESGQGPWGAISQVQRTSLHVMTAGQALSASLPQLDTASLQALFDEIALAFDFVILDTTPLLLAADATLLARVADGVLLVVHAGSTPRELVLKAKRLVDARKMLGVVLRGVDPMGYGYSQYGRYYDLAPPKKSFSLRDILKPGGRPQSR